MELGWPDLPGFRPVRSLRRGNASVAFLALDEHRGGPPVAVEVFSSPPGLQAEELRRLRLAALPLSPNLARGEVLDAGQGRWAFVAPVPEFDLRSQLRRWRAAGAVPRDEALPIFAAVAEALDAWFERHGLAHGGASLEAIGWHGDAWRLSPAPPRLPRDGVPLAPEAAAGRGFGRSDQYRLAAALFEGLAGLTLARLHGEVPGLVPHELAALRKALAPDPAARWDSCTAMVAAVAGVAAAPAEHWWIPYGSSDGLERALGAFPHAPIRQRIDSNQWALRWANGVEAEGLNRRDASGLLLVAVRGPSAPREALAAALSARPAAEAPVRRGPRFPCRLRATLAAGKGPLKGVPVECLAVDRSEVGVRVLGPLSVAGDVAFRVADRSVAGRVVRAQRRPDGVSFELGLELPAGWHAPRVA